MSAIHSQKRSSIATLGTLYPVLQPIVPLPWSGETCVIHEMLARIRTHDGIVLHPVEFMEGAISIEELDLAMLAKVPRLQTARSDLVLSANAAPASFCSDAYFKNIQSMIRSREIDPARLIVEITEDATDTSLDLMILDRAETLREMGIQIALDDFGSGGNGIARLSAGIFDLLKISRGIDLMSTRGRIIIESVISIAEKISVAGLNGRQMRVVLEGIERDEQLVLANQLNINYVQGNLLGLPREVAVQRKDILGHTSSLLAGNFVFA